MADLCAPWFISACRRKAVLKQKPYQETRESLIEINVSRPYIAYDRLAFLFFYQRFANDSHPLTRSGIAVGRHAAP
mgnify:CR=1 FL=1